MVRKDMSGTVDSAHESNDIVAEIVGIFDQDFVEEETAATTRTRGCAKSGIVLLCSS